MGNITITYGTESSRYGATISDETGHRQGTHISNAKETAETHRAERDHTEEPATDRD